MAEWKQSKNNRRALLPPDAEGREQAGPRDSAIRRRDGGDHSHNELLEIAMRELSQTTFSASREHGSTSGLQRNASSSGTAKRGTRQCGCQPQHQLEI